MFDGMTPFVAIGMSLFVGITAMLVIVLCVDAYTVNQFNREHLAYHRQNRDGFGLYCSACAARDHQVNVNSEKPPQTAALTAAGFR